VDFNGVFEEIRSFLGPVVKAELAGESMQRSWNRKERKWN
jgi:hypothetical protein